MWQNAIGKVKNFLPAFGISSAIISGFNKLKQLIRESLPAYREYDDKLADVMKTTGLAKNEVEALSKSLKKIDTRTPQNELLDLARVAGKLGIESAQEVEGFVRAADKINVALSEDLGGNAEEALNEVGKLVDIFFHSAAFHHSYLPCQLLFPRFQGIYAQLSGAFCDLCLDDGGVCADLLYVQDGQRFHAARKARAKHEGSDHLAEKAV